MMTAEQFILQLKELEHKLDFINRPYAIYIDPIDKKQLLREMPDLEEKYDVITWPLLELGKIIIVDREKLEKREEKISKLFEFDLNILNGERRSMK